MKKIRLDAGIGPHVLVASAIAFSGIIKLRELFGNGPPTDQEYFLLLGIAELANAFLLLIPRTMSIGILISKAGWGAAIALTLT